MPNGQPRIRTEAHENQVVVDLKQVDEVLEILTSIQVSWSSVSKNHTLRLALVTLENVSVPAGYVGAPGKSDLDRLISYLRDAFKKQDKKLVIGKNRIVGSVVGSPYVGGGEGIPTPYVGGGEGIPTPYVGGALTSSPYAAAGSPPYVGGGLAGIQLLPPTGTLPKRTQLPGKGVGVGILDTRLFPHPDLDGRYLASYGTLASEVPARPPDQEAHATFIAGVVLEWAPNANLVVDHVLNEEDIATSSWRVATKMARFADAGVTVLNISFGAATDDDEAPLVLTRAVEVLNTHGVVVVAAAGNNGPSKRKIWPAALPDVVAVGAGTNTGGQFVSAKFSPKASWVDLTAPGVEIYSTYKASGYATWSGTSFASAAVSGAIAYLMETVGITAEKAVAWLLTPPADRKDPAVTAAIDDIGPQ
jgi:Subtilase family